MQTLKTPSAPKPVSIKLDSDLKARLDAVAAFKDRTPHWLMQDAIATYVEREEKQAALLKETLAVHEHYVLTGLHLSEDAMDAWMDDLIAGKNVDPPECQS